MLEEVLHKSNNQKLIYYEQLTIQELIGTDIDQVPDYLCEANDSFEKLIYSMRSNLPKKHLEQFRYVAILMHKIFLLEKLINLWTLYQKCGLGQLKISIQYQPSNLQIWLENIFARLKHIHGSLNRINMNGSQHTECQLFVDECLKKLSDKFSDYHYQLQMNTVRLEDFTFSMEHTIEKFIQYHFKYQSLQYDCLIETVQYQYIDALLKQHYANEHPSERHVTMTILST